MNSRPAAFRIVRLGEKVPAAATGPARHHRPGQSLYTAGLAVIAGWGVFSFGAVYPWGYQPLLIASAVAGALGIAMRRPAVGVPWPLIVALIVLNCAVLLQLVALPRGPLLAFSPRAGTFLQEYALGFMADQRAAHALSIDPPRTWLALGCLAAFSLLFVGVAISVGRRGASRLCSLFVMLGAAVAIEGLVQRVVSPLAIYGFWAPTGENPAYFGPFVNRNHFAGWMLMTLPLSLGYLAHLAQKSLVDVRPAWRHWLAWLSSPHASGVILVAFVASTMTLSLFLTMSRSGMGALVVALFVAVAGLFRSRVSRGGAMAAALVIAALLTITVAAIGSDLVLGRFDAPDSGGFQGRLGAWRDAWTVAREFPLTGTGLNTFGAAMLRYQTHDMHKWYSTAHNDYLQLAAEGGVLLVLPSVVLAAVFAREVRRRLRQDDPATFWIRIGAVCGVLAIALQEAVDFSLQMPGNAVIFALVAAIAIHRVPAMSEPRQRHGAAPRSQP